MKSIKEIRKIVKKIIITKAKSENIYLRSFKKNFYTFLKWQYLIFVGPYFIKFFTYMKISPNIISSLNILLCGILPCIFILLDNFILLILALLLIFNKTILDMCDGFVARELSLTSLSGEVVISRAVKAYLLIRF